MNKKIVTLLASLMFIFSISSLKAADYNFGLSLIIVLIPTKIAS